MTTAAILLAGGRGSRMRRADNKVFASVGGRPLMAWSAVTFARTSAVDHIVIVARDGDERRIAAVVEHAGVDVPVRIARGGASRQDSELSGLDLIARTPDLHTVDVVLVHDVARPFVTGALVEGIAAATATVGGAVPGLPLGTGVYRVGDDGRLAAQPDDLYRMQTPQGFRATELLDAYRRAAADGFVGVDTAETVQRYTALEIALLPGDPDNIKVTFADDLGVAEAIAERRGN